MRIAHSAVALQVAQVEVTVEQIGFASGQVEDVLHVLHSPDAKSQDNKLSDADQHWAWVVQATQLFEFESQIGVEPEQGWEHWAFTELLKANKATSNKLDTTMRLFITASLKRCSQGMPKKDNFNGNCKWEVQRILSCALPSNPLRMNQP